MTEFQRGVVAMARSCVSAIDMIRLGAWTLDDTEQWLKDTIKADGASEPLDPQSTLPATNTAAGEINQNQTKG